MASDTPWSNFTQADFSAQQFARACLIDREEGVPDSKDRYSLPVREPSGVVNRNAVHDAAAKIVKLEGISADKKFVAARKLITMYRTDLAETPPDSLVSMVAIGERSVTPEIERLWTNNWQGFKNGSPVEIRKSPDGGHLIGGYAAVYNTRSVPMQSFVEIVENSFFNKSRADDWPGVVCRFDHNNMMLLGTSASGTLRLAPDNIGLDYTVQLPECRSDVWELVDRRDVRNSSFAFQVFDDEFTYDEGYPVRHLVSGKLIDVAPVVTPAYPDATVGLRSLARHVGAPYEEVIKRAEKDELRSFFVRTDNNGKPAKKKSGRQALLEVMAMEDPSLKSE
jgi:HK97 family phage prohead protease